MAKNTLKYKIPEINLNFDKMKNRMQNFFNSIYNFLDIKLTIFGAGFIYLNLTTTDVVLSIIGSTLFIGYTLHRWYLLVKNRKNKNEYN